MEKQKAFIEINNLSKVIKEQSILDNINIKINSGTIIGFVGRNGSGKSVLFKCICGFMIPTSGKVIIDDKIIGKDMDFPDSTGVLIESPGYMPQYSGFKNLRILADIKNKIDNQTIKDYMKKVGLDPNNKKKVKNYSLGMKQKLGITQAIMEKPRLIVLDEVMNSLDKQTVQEIRNLLLNLKEEGTTILVTSHIEEDIKILCDEIYEIDQGRIIKDKIVAK